MSTDLLLRGRPAEGLLVLHSGLRNSELVQADALVFLDLDSHQAIGGDVLVMSVQLREPNGHGHARLGRFMLSTGAIRPVQIDGVSVLGRAPSGSSLEVFAGAPVVPEFGGRDSDWLAGARAGQQLVEERVTFGVSYLHRRDAGQVSDEELGADAGARVSDWLSVNALGAWDLTAQGLAEVRAGAIAHDERDQLEVFVSHRVAARLLPATSLFSVISDTAGTQVGASGGYRAFPRLDLGASAALEGLSDDLGYSVALRSTLFLSDSGDGSVGLEATRRKLGREGWTGAALALWIPVATRVRAHATTELVAADHPEDRGNIWPWVRVGASYTPAPEWLIAAAVGVKGTPQYRHESYGLLRVAFSSEVLP